MFRRVFSLWTTLGRCYRPMFLFTSYCASFGIDEILDSVQKPSNRVFDGTFNTFTERKFVMTKTHKIIFGVVALTLISLTAVFALNSSGNSTSKASSIKAEGSSCCCSHEAKADTCPKDKCKNTCENGCVCSDGCKCSTCSKATDCCCGENCKCCDGCKGGNCTCEDCKCCDCCTKATGCGCCQ